MSLLAIMVATGATGAAADTMELRPSVYDNVYQINALGQDPVSAPVRHASTDDPYAPLGISAGGFTLFPTIAFGIGTTNNASSSAGGVPGSFWSIAPMLDIRSNWDTNSANVLLSGAYQDFFNNAAPAEPAGSANGNLHLDLADRFSVDFTGRATYSEQSLSDPNYPAGADTPPGVIGLDGTAALNGSFGRLRVTLAGGAERTIYDDAMSGNTVIDQGDRTNTLYSGRVRVGYELNPSLTPFIETEVGRRLYDRLLDNEGIDRASTSYALRAGIAIDRDPLLKGEIAVGAIHESFDDATLADINALSFEGTLTWSPRRLLTVTLAGNTSLNPTTDALSSGSVFYTGSFDIAYAWRRNVTFDWISYISNEAYEGIGQVDTTLNTGISATWKLNRDVQVVASYTHQWLVSTDPSLPYQSDTIQAALKLLR